jgi:hypothetical protein
VWFGFPSKEAETDLVESYALSDASASA